MDIKLPPVSTPRAGLVFMDPDIVDEVATALGESLIDQILENKPGEAIKTSLGADAPVWYQNLTEGVSPLHAAAYVQNADLVKLLIEKGAIWNAGSFLSRSMTRFLFTVCSRLSEKYSRGHSPFFQ